MSSPPFKSLIEPIVEHTSACFGCGEPAVSACWVYLTEETFTDLVAKVKANDDTPAHGMSIYAGACAEHHEGLQEAFSERFGGCAVGGRLPYDPLSFGAKELSSVGYQAAVALLDKLTPSTDAPRRAQEPSVPVIDNGQGTKAINAPRPGHNRSRSNVAASDADTLREGRAEY